MRLINADALETHEIYEGEWVRVIYADDIDNAPTIDAVEVVRCGKCEWRNDRGLCTYIAQIYPPVASSHFCGYGKPKDDTGGSE